MDRLDVGEINIRIGSGAYSGGGGGARGPPFLGFFSIG